MGRAVSLYPPSPRNVPEDLTRPTGRYRLQVFAVLLSLVLFFLLYLGMVAGSAYLVYLAIVFPVSDVNRGTVAVKLGAIGCSALLFLFLLKGLFKRQRDDRSMRVEITEDSQPRLFAFIRRLCDEIGAPFPHRIYVSPEVNAAVFYHRSVLSLVLPTPKNLLIGLGLVNVLNLSEFKAVLAHEFGHFSQNSMKLGSYVYVFQHILADMVYGRDWLDDLLARLKSVDARLAVFAWVFAGILWGLRKFLAGCFRLITFSNSALSRQMEFNADLVAVSVSGSDALVHGLARLDFANEALVQAMQDLATAADHKLYTSDLYYHQNHAAAYLRRLRKDPTLGEPPPIPDDVDLTVEVFEPGDDGIPLMWATHPSNYDREQNAKRHYVRSPMDDRSPWVLFENPEKLRDKVTWRFYRVQLKVPRDVVVAEPEAVQSFIDDEHAETTYDARYHGLYDGRYLDPGDVRELVQQVTVERWSVDKLARAYDGLYSGELEKWMEVHNQRVAEYQLLSGLDQGELKLKGKDFEFRNEHYSLAEVKRLLKKVDRELEKDRTWLAELDRKVFVVHYRMALDLGDGSDRELLDRYAFHQGVEDLFRGLTEEQGRIGAALAFLTSNRQLSPEQFRDVVGRLKKAHKALWQALNTSRSLVLPALKNMDAGEPLRGFLLEQRLVPEPDPNGSSLSGQWIGKFLEQFGGVHDKLRRIHFKSLGAILALQEAVGKEWKRRLEELPEAVPVEAPKPATKPGSG